MIVFWPVLFQGRLLLPTDQFDTMTLPFSGDHGPPQTYNHNLTDAMMQSYPWKVEAQRAFRKGEFYYWNRLILNGYPQYAASRQTYDVFNLLLIPCDLPFAFNLILVLELFTAGIGMYVLLRVHGSRRVIALMFASAWMFNGMFLMHVLNLWAVATFCWVPFALAFSLKYQRTRSFGYLLTAGCFLGLAFLGATIQTAMYAFFSFALVTSAWSLQSHNGRVRGILRCVAIPSAVALCLSAVMWLPALELFIQVIQHGTLYSPTHGHPYSLIDRLISFLLLPAFFAPELLGIVRSVSLTSLAGVHPLDFSGYLGFTEMLMALWAVFTIRFSDKEVRPYAWLILLGFLLPIFTPLFAWLYHRFFIVGTLGLAVLGAERLESFLNNPALREKGRRWAKWALISGAAACGALLFANIAWIVNPQVHAWIESNLMHFMSGTAYAEGNTSWIHDRIAGTFAHYSILSPMMLIPFGVCFVACLLLIQWRQWTSDRKGFLVLLLFACSILQNIFWWRSFIPMLDPNEYPLLPQNHSIHFLQEHVDGYRTFIDRRGYQGKQYLFLDNLPSLYNISVISGYESEVPWSFYPQVKQIFPSSPHPRALGLMGVKYLMFVPDVVPAGTLPVVDSGNVMIYQDTFARPRATLYYSAQTLQNDSDVLASIFDESNPHYNALFSLGSQPPFLKELSLLATSWDSARILKEDINSIEIIAAPSQNACLVLSDTYYPGWKCYVDGVEQPIYRVNYAMRGVFLNSGSHHVLFQFEPLSFKIGSTVSMLSSLFLIGALIFSQVRFRKDRE